MLLKKILFISLFIGRIVIFPASLFAYVIDGDLSEWGVTPFTHWTPAASSVAYTVSDNKRPDGNPVRGENRQFEVYDVEAFYFDEDITAGYFNFAMVTSCPLSLQQNGQIPAYVAGDLGIGLNTLPAPGYNYGLKLRWLSSEEIIQNPQAWKDPVWQNGDFGIGPAIMLSGNNIGNPGDVEVFYKNLGYIEGDYWHSLYPVIDPETYGNTYILEGRIKRSLFNLGPTDKGTIVFNWAETCGNDYIRLSSNFHAIPEPGTLWLLGVGLLGLLGRKKLLKKEII